LLIPRPILFLCGKMCRVAVSHDSALLVVDMQVDFCEGGALPVEGCLKIIPTINELIKLFRSAGARVIASRDWHPPNHISFRERGGPWPPHCVRGTRGAEFHPNLELPDDALVISKATDPDREAYSAFDGTELHYVLSREGVRKVFIAGVAAEYCVKASALDALKLDYEVYLITDAVAAVRREGGEKALNDVLREGGVLISSDEVVRAEGLENA